MKRILINATQTEELRVAMVDGQLLYDLDIEVPSREQKKSNIYKGIITRVEPSLEAAFVNYGAERHGFLPFKEISRQYFSEETKNSEDGRVNIKDAIKEGQEIIIQVEKEERGNKGAALTTFVSLAGRFLVAMPQNPRAGGVSRRIEGEERDSIRNVMSELQMAPGMGVIARTAGVGRTTEEMQWDLDYLTQLWAAVEQAASERPAPFLIYQESDIVIRALRDHYKTDVGEIIIDSQDAYDRAHEFMSMVIPNALYKLKKFDDKLPLFNRFQIENQIESAFSREVTLTSGGAIVIDHTEALISIDVNSARATKGTDIEDTALHTNLEAAEEIARQLRIRDLGGLVVIDFIDMMKNKNQRDVEQRLRNAVYEDRARVQIGRISRFGLLEMSRQRLRPSIGESSQIVCPRCCGQGSIRDVESLSLSIMRLLEEDAIKENTGRLVARLPVVIATYLLNEKRSKLAEIESRYKVHCVIIPDLNLETPHFEIERVRDSETQRHESSHKSSYEMASEDPVSHAPEVRSSTSTAQTAAVQRITPPTPIPQSVEAPAAPAPVKSKEGGLFSKVFNAIFGTADKSSETERNESDSVSNRSDDSARRAGNKNRNRTTQPRNRNNQRNNQRNQSGNTQDNEAENNRAPRHAEKIESTASSTDKNNAQQAEASERPKRPRKKRAKNPNRRNNANRQPRTDQSTAGSENSSESTQPANSQPAQQSPVNPTPAEMKPAHDRNSQPNAQAPQAAPAQTNQGNTSETAGSASTNESNDVDGNVQKSRPKRSRSRTPRRAQGSKPATRQDNSPQDSSSAAKESGNVSPQDQAAKPSQPVQQPVNTAETQARSATAQAPAKLTEQKEARPDAARDRAAAAAASSAVQAAQPQPAVQSEKPAASTVSSSASTADDNRPAQTKPAQAPVKPAVENKPAKAQDAPPAKPVAAASSPAAAMEKKPEPTSVAVKPAEVKPAMEKPSQPAVKPAEQPVVKPAPAQAAEASPNPVKVSAPKAATTPGSDSAGNN
ncbi:MAG: Rne/Rng family ribonuclease [Gammaproteobacteria bacterium]|nr:Rne/Rng family ribonuclease [Gammaproteobacteria bacterium]